MEAKKNSTNFLKIFIDNMPFPVFIKDELRRYAFINEQEAQLFNLKSCEIIGKTDADFLKDKSEIKLIEKSDEDVLSGKKVELPNQIFSLKDGRTYIFKTYKFPIINPNTGKVNVFGISTDVTDSVSLTKLKKVLILNSNPYT
ncbi:PAS domain-containing protein [Cytophagaceae bacterium ABcell3]|nr:PAS domain-containing protein [Cytophagaceae bacterium ABcell3]